MIDKGLYKRGRVGLKGGADASQFGKPSSQQQTVNVGAGGATLGNTPLTTYTPPSGGDGGNNDNPFRKTPTKKKTPVKTFLTRGANFAKKNPLQVLLGFLNPVFGAAMLGANFLNNPERRKRLTGYETQAEYDQARQDRINRKRIATLENTIQKKYLDKGRSLDETELDERLAALKESMGIQDTAPNVMTGRDLNLRGIETLDTGNNIIDNMISNIDKLSNQPNLQELYDRDKTVSLMENFIPAPGQTDYFPSQIDNTGINFYNDDAVPLDPNLNIFKVNDKFAELTDKQKRFIDSKKFPLQENLVSPQSVYETITNPDLGIYDTGTFGFGAQEPTTEEEYNDYLRSLGLTQTI